MHYICQLHTEHVRKQKPESNTASCVKSGFFFAVTVTMFFIKAWISPAKDVYLALCAASKGNTIVIVEVFE